MGTISRDLGICIEKLCEAGVDRQMWIAGLENLCRALNAYGVVLIPRHHPYLALDFPLSPSLERFAERFVWEEWSRRSPKFEALWALLGDRNAVSLVTDFVTDAEYDTEPLFKNLFQPADTRWWVGIVFNMNGEDCVLSIHRRREQGPFNREDQRTLHRFRRHIVHPFTACNEIAMARDLGELGAFQRVNRAAVFIDRSGRITCSNKKIEQFDSEVSVSDERIFARDRDVNEMLQEKINLALHKAITGNMDTNEPMLVARRDKLPLVIHFFPVSERNKIQFGRSKVLLSVFDPMDRLSAAPGLGARLFALSPAETRLATHLSQGVSVREAAAELRISYGTARTQLKSIFHKANVRRQSDLVGLFLSLHD